MKKIELKDLHLGDIDAKYELLEGIATLDDKERFFESFLIPENIMVDSFLEGQYFYITGMKGIGKTALLRYIGIEAEKRLNARTSFVLFKSDFSVDDKDEFEKANGNIVIDRSEFEKTENVDYEPVWRWLIHKRIIENIEKYSLNTFEDNDYWKKYKEYIQLPKLFDEGLGIKRHIPNITNGFVKTENIAENELLSNFDVERENEIKFSSIIKRADGMFENLIVGSDYLFIIIDELELSYENDQYYIRDKHLIRDLILAIEKVNLLCKRKKANVRIICGIRSEVLASVETTGREINKPIDRFGVPIMWNQSGDDLNHPLLKILLKRIGANEKVFGLEQISDKELWKKWFAETVNDTPIQKYLIHHTWYRPRDIIRMLNIAKKLYPRSSKFEQYIFDKIRKPYATESWIEIVEELSATYDTSTISSIKSVLYGFQRQFTYKELQDHVKKLSVTDVRIRKFNNIGNLDELLDHLYRVGVIGNLIGKGGQRWFYRGDDELLKDRTITVHRALWPYLSLYNNYQNIDIIDERWNKLLELKEL